MLRFGREQVIANAKIEREPTPGPPVVLDVETGFLCAVPRLVKRCAPAHNGRRPEQQIRQSVVGCGPRIRGVGVERELAARAGALHQRELTEDQTGSKLHVMRTTRPRDSAGILVGVIELE